MARRGKFTPRNPGKWVSPNNIIYRSSIEQRYFNYFDLNKSIIRIASEKIIIPYVDLARNKQRHYYIDLIIQYKQNDIVFTRLIEIKSFSESVKPKKPKKLTESYKNAVATWITNQCKWNAATAYAKSKGWEFCVLTERDLPSRKLRKKHEIS